MAEMDWLSQFVNAIQDPSVGGGYGQLPPTATEIIKAGMKVVNDQSKLTEATNAAVSAIPNAPDQLPLAQTLSQAVAGGYNPADLRNLDGSTPGRDFLAGLNTTAGAGGLAALLGTVGAAVSRPGSWQERLGTASAGMGRGAVAADAVKQLTDKLAASTPVTPPNAGQPGGANFPVAPLLLPPVLKLGQ